MIEILCLRRLQNVVFYQADANLQTFSIESIAVRGGVCLYSPRQWIHHYKRDVHQ